ncbi:MAG: hypothetical protein JNK48_34610 [Bryobacterales bacterium]|nr:hypothetical protein [Bryobacterales bacterium]
MKLHRIKPDIRVVVSPAGLSMRIPVLVEHYSAYTPPGYVRDTVRKLVEGLPEQCIAGLRCVVLTNAAALPKGSAGKVRKRRLRRRHCLGFYHPAGRDGGAWIEIVVDNAIAGWRVPAMLMRVPIVRETVLAETLFHELGHHLDMIAGAAAPSGEQAAEDWRRRLFGMYLRKRYWYLRPLVQLAKIYAHRRR